MSQLKVANTRSSVLLEASKWCLALEAASIQKPVSKRCWEYQVADKCLSIAALALAALPVNTNWMVSRQVSARRSDSGRKCEEGQGECTSSEAC